MTRQIRLLVNPSAGKGRALEILPDVAGSLRDGGANLEILLSRDFAEAKSMAHQAIADGVDVLAVMGGDGMMHLGVNTSAAAHAEGRSRTTLGLIPAGTGNDLCRGIGLPPKDAVAAAEVIAAGHSRSIDLARVAETYVAAVLATGFDASGESSGQPDALAARIDAVRTCRDGRAAGVLSAALPAHPGRADPEAAGHVGGHRQHQLLRRWHADLSSGRPL